jgi:phosphoglycolate phosphatase
MSIKAVFFDLDGTLMDTAPDFILTLNQLCDEYKIPRLPEEKIRETVSDGARALTTLALNLEENESGFEEGRERLLSIYDDFLGVGSKLFDNMLPLIDNLEKHALDWGIATNKPYRFAHTVVSNSELNGVPKVLLCPDHVKKAKPDPEMLKLACEQVNCKPSESIYIGDHKRDIDCGKDFGCITISAAYGYVHANDNVQDWAADHIAHTVEDIWPLIKSYI